MDELQQAKHPKTVLAGPYGHPFHPVVVTVPIGAWVAGAVFEVIALASSEREAVFAEGAYWPIGIGIVGAVLAAAFGLMDLLAIPRGTKAFRTGLIHMALNLVVVILFVIDFAVRAGQGYDEASVVGFVLSLVALALLGISGSLGGKLAYHYGGPGRERGNPERRLSLTTSRMRSHGAEVRRDHYDAESFPTLNRSSYRSRAWARASWLIRASG